jgi:ketosteroid isomerase-like protein
MGEGGRALAMKTPSAETTMRAMFGAYREAGPEAVFDFLDPDVEWEVRAALPDAEVYRGHDGIRRLFARFDEVMADQWYEPRGEPVEVGDRFVVPLRWGGRGRGSGVEFEEREETWVYTVRSGKIVHVKEFAASDEALAWARENESAR